MTTTKPLALVFGLAAALLPACKARQAPAAASASIKDEAVYTAAKHTIILVGVGKYAPENDEFDDLPGSGPDLQQLGDLYTELGWQVIRMLDKTPEEVIGETRRVVASLEPGATLHWHFEGHGDSGLMVFPGRRMAFPEIAASLNAAWEGKSGPLSRLIVTMDACFSGAVDAHVNDVPSGGFSPSFADDARQSAAFGTVWRENEAELKPLSERFVAHGGSGEAQDRPFLAAIQGAFTRGGGLALTGRVVPSIPARQLIVIGSAAPTQTAADWGVASPFSLSWMRTVSTLKRTNHRDARVRDLLETAKKMTSRLTKAEQVPNYWAEPDGAAAGETLLYDGDDPVF